MAESTKEYRRLPGRRGWIFVYHRLYQGRDHLLNVTGRLYTETYKRFYFRDIQAIVCQKSIRGRVWTGILASVALLLLLPVLIQGRDANLFWFLATLFFSAILIAHILLGPTSACYIRTAVQTEPLPSLGRLRKAAKVVARLQALIEQDQSGSLSAEALADSDLAAGAALPPGPRDAAGQPLRPERGNWHTFLYFWLLVEAGANAMYFLVSGMGLFVAASLVSMALPIFTIVALVKQAGSDLPVLVKGATWTSGAYTAYRLVVGLVVYFVVSLDSNPADTLALYRAVAEISPYSSDAMMVVFVVSIVCSLVLGLLGLLGLALRRPAAPGLVTVKP